MEAWQDRMKRMFTLPDGNTAVAGFDDEQRVVVINPDVDAETVQGVEELVRDERVGYRIRQLA